MVSKMLSCNAFKGIHYCLLFLTTQLWILTGVQASALPSPTNDRCLNRTVLLDATSTPQTIQSPGYPSPYGNNEDCRWKISAAQGVIKITVQHYSIELSAPCIYDSLNIYDGNLPESVCNVTLCGVSYLPEEYITSSNEAFIHFHTDVSYTSSGFSLTYQNVDGTTASTIPCTRSAPSTNDRCPRDNVLYLDATSTPQVIKSPNYPYYYGNNENCRWKISAPRGVINITVLHYDIEFAQPCVYDSLHIYEVASPGSFCKVTICGMSYSSEEYITSSNEALIHFQTGASSTYPGFFLIYQYVDASTTPTIPCAPSVPSSPITGICLNGRVLTVDATSTPQTIQSLNYPYPYEMNQYCQWKISAPRGVINITVLYYDIEYSQLCVYDSLDIYDGPSIDSACKVTLCGVSKSYDQYITSSNEALIRFRSDSALTFTGFVLTYQYLDGNTTPTIPCEPTVPSAPTSGSCPSDSVRALDATSTPQTIQSLNYPYPYENNENCRWKIIAPQGVINITVLHYSIEFSYSCGYDNLTIYDGTSTASACKVTLCGESESYDQYITSSNEALIHFRSDGSLTNSGFILTYQYVDGYTVPSIPCATTETVPSSPTGSTCPNDRVLTLDATSTPQTIQSSNYPNQYENNENCRWKISAPMGFINITVLQYDIEFDQSCIYDSLSIYDGPTENSACKVTLCGYSETYGQYITSSNEALIRFLSDSSLSYGGFILTYQYVEGNTTPTMPCV